MIVVSGIEGLVASLLLDGLGNTPSPELVVSATVGLPSEPPQPLIINTKKRKYTMINVFVFIKSIV